MVNEPFNWSDNITCLRKKAQEIPVSCQEFHDVLLNDPTGLQEKRIDVTICPGSYCELCFPIITLDRGDLLKMVAVKVIENLHTTKSGIGLGIGDPKRNPIKRGKIINLKGGSYSSMINDLIDRLEQVSICPINVETDALDTDQFGPGIVRVVIIYETYFRFPKIPT